MLIFVYIYFDIGVKALILDDLKNLKNYKNISDYIENCINFIKTHNLAGMDKGRYEIAGKNLYVNIDEYTTKEKTESLPELHKNYADIQTVIQGKEYIGYSDGSDCKTEIEYDSEKDIEFLKGECEYFKAENSRFFMFLPNEIHHPCIMNGKKEFVKKAVFKLKIN